MQHPGIWPTISPWGIFFCVQRERERKNIGQLREPTLPFPSTCTWLICLLIVLNFRSWINVWRCNLFWAPMLLIPPERLELASRDNTARGNAGGRQHAAGRGVGFPVLCGIRQSKAGCRGPGGPRRAFTAAWAAEQVHRPIDVKTSILFKFSSLSRYVLNFSFHGLNKLNWECKSQPFFAFWVCLY